MRVGDGGIGLLGRVRPAEVAGPVARHDVVETARELLAIGLAPATSKRRYVFP